jgi:hypothetical protein
MIGYSGNFLVNVIGSDRIVSPYVEGGVGGLTLFSSSDVTSLGILKDETYLTGNVGGGVKWYASRHVGLRGDVRAIVVENKQGSIFDTDHNRWGGRIYAGLLLTY